MQGDKAKLGARTTLGAGQRYDVRYVYDVVAQRGELTIASGGVQLLRLRDAPNASDIAFDGKRTLDFDFGFNGDNPAEPPTYGWQYRDLHVVMHER